MCLEGDAAGVARDFYDAFEEVYSISDLHLSDKQGADATSTTKLCELLEKLVGRAARSS